MIDNFLKEKAHQLVELAKSKGLVMKYEDFIKTDLAKETALTTEEIQHYKEKYHQQMAYVDSW